ncbi:MAG: 1-acyl-sn-glycerol-3-phosphate acyltransferase [Clostridia bacterium]|nr:1-acyl-sn-glycerol-3-phosphate acyltransferase [Clostridia bacterium]
MYKFLRFICYLPVKILLPTKVIGKENLDKEGRIIIACNHQSILDIAILIINLKRKIHFVGKKEIFKNKFLKWFFTKMGVIELDRDNLDLYTIKKIISVLKNEEVLGIFPEGTRNKTEEPLLSFRDGTTLFAEKTNAPVVPMIITRMPKIFRRNKLIIGEKIYFEKGNEDNTEKLREKMLDMKTNTIKETK